MNSNAEQQIDNVLAALGSAQPPEGLEQRVARRLAHAAETHVASTSFLRPTHAIFALTAVAVAAVLVGLHHGRSHSLTQATASLPAQPRTGTRSIAPSQNLTVAAHPHSAAVVRFKPVAQLNIASSSEELALAETRAPRLLAPTMPLTQQELLLRSATRSGGLAQLAQLEPDRQAELRAVQLARQKKQVDRYIKRMLANMAVAEVLNPTAPADSPAAPPS